MKILTVVGARPQFIKASLVSQRLRKERGLREVLVHTGQHYDFNMSGSFFKELNIKAPDYNLNIGSLSALSQVAQMISRLGQLHSKEKPDLVMVYGDTNSTLAGALSAVNAHLPVAHVEAGLRSFDLTMPEEVNRVLTDHVSSVLFCPTKEAVKNLKKENIVRGVYEVGDIMYELALKSAKAALRSSRILERLNLSAKDYLLLTVHRQANTDNKGNLASIVRAIAGIDRRIVFPVHPRTKKMLSNFGILKKIKKSKNVLMIDPVGYLDMVCLEINSAKIMTDSGGVQKEAYFFKVPCITLRERTEWVETINGGWNKLVGVDAKKIIKAACDNRRFGPQKSYYGNGDTSKRIVDILKKTRLS